MEKYKTIIVTNVVIFIALGVLMSAFGLAGVGAVGVILGGCNLLVALFSLIGGVKKNLLQGCLICGGILLLIGFSLCSAFPVRL
jgi:hypothetical protein